MNQRKTSHQNRPRPSMLRAAVLLVLVLFGFWYSRDPDKPASRPLPSDQSTEVIEPAKPAAEEPATPPANLEASRSHFPEMAIRDLDGKVIFRGTVDVQPTLDRIAAGERLKFRNDGSTFENRERRLPHKPAGYYKEYVHPTASLTGPGPQRIVIGRDGEAYYTPDHYRTFHRIR